MPWAKNFLSSRQNLDTVLSPLSDPTRLPPLASSWNVHPGLQSKQNSCICEHRLLFSPSSSSSIFHHLYPQTCMRTHTHFSHPQFSHSQAVTSPHMDTRASSDPRAHRVFTHPPCPFPASTCFSPASFSSAFSLWFCLLINCSRQTVGSSAKMWKYLGWPESQGHGAHAPHVGWKLASPTSAINFVLPPPC